MDISDRFDIPIVVELLAKVSNVASELNGVLSILQRELKEGGDLPLVVQCADSINNSYGAGSRFDMESPTNPYGQGLSIFGDDDG